MVVSKATMVPVLTKEMKLDWMSVAHLITFRVTDLWTLLNQRDWSLAIEEVMRSCARIWSLAAGHFGNLIWSFTQVHGRSFLRSKAYLRPLTRNWPLDGAVYNNFSFLNIITVAMDNNIRGQFHIFSWCWTAEEGNPLWWPGSVFKSQLILSYPSVRKTSFTVGTDRSQKGSVRRMRLFLTFVWSCSERDVAYTRVREDELAFKNELVQH